MSVKRYLKVLLFAAIIFVSSFFCKIKTGNFYPISLTSGIILIIATYIKPEDSFTTAGFPCALAAIALKQGFYGVYVFFIYGTTCLIISLINQKGKVKLTDYLVVLFIELVLKVIVDIILFNGDIFLSSLLFNGIQVLIAFILVFLYNLIIKKKS